MFDATSADPTEVVAEVLRLLEAEEYEQASALYHPEYAKLAARDAHLWARPPRREVDPERLLELYPDMPREAAEYQARQSNNRPPDPPSFDELFGVESEAQLAELEPREVLARALWGGDARWRFRAYLDDLMEQHPKYRVQLQEQKAALRYLWSGSKALGWIEQLDRAYVVMGGDDDSVRSRSSEVGDEGLASITVLRKGSDGWRISCGLGLSGGFIQYLHVPVIDENGDRIVLS